MGIFGGHGWLVWACLDDPPGNFFGTFEVYISHGLFHYVATWVSARRGTRVIKKSFPRTKVSRAPLGPRKWRYVARICKKHARLFTRNKRSVLSHQRRLHARKDRFQHFIVRQQRKNQINNADNPNNFDQARPDDRFTSQKIQWIKTSPFKVGRLVLLLPSRAKQRMQTNNGVLTRAIPCIPCLVSFSIWFRNLPKKEKTKTAKTTPEQRDQVLERIPLSYWSK